MLHTAAKSTRRPGLAPALIALMAALTVAGCATGGASGTHGMRVEGRAELMDQSQLRQAERHWASRYERDESNKSAGLNYAATLRAQGRTRQAVAVLRNTVVAHENDRQVLTAYAKALTANGDFNEALQVIGRAHNEASPDWQLLSAQGTILDQLGRHAEAREAYGRALQIQPDEPTVLSNVGMSYVLEGNLAEAERTLRQALRSGRGVDPRVRANLALVVGLQGRFDEAMQIAREDLPPQQADENIAYLRSMLSQSDRWNELSQLDG